MQYPAIPARKIKWKKSRVALNIPVAYLGPSHLRSESTPGAGSEMAVCSALPLTRMFLLNVASSETCGMDLLFHHAGQAICEITLGRDSPRCISLSCSLSGPALLLFCPPPFPTNRIRRQNNWLFQGLLVCRVQPGWLLVFPFRELSRNSQLEGNKGTPRAPPSRSQGPIWCSGVQWCQWSASRSVQCQ